MDYEKKYKEALERARKIHHETEFDYEKGMMEEIFPEIKDSEDERIMKAIKGGIKHLETQLGYDAVDGVDILDIYSWLEKQGEPEDKGEISDGYHTFNELYSYRMLYNAAFFNLLPKQLVHKSKRHHDGEECFGGGWFIVMANLPTGQISNHYELKDWDLFQIPEKEIADEWDGHTPQEAAERLHKYLLEKQNEQPTDKVEPKFNVGDWIILPLGIIAHIDSLNSTDYQVTTTDGKICDFKISKQDNYRLWTITDAKDGDLIYVSTEEKGIQAIFHEYKNDTIFFHCYLCTDFVQGGYMPIGSVELTYPLQKTHYSRFFEKMHKAGYEWDGEKKELKKIESKMLNAEEVIDWLDDNICNAYDYDGNEITTTLKSKFKQDFGL